MKNVRNLLATIILTAILVVSASTAKAGIMLTDLRTGDMQPCTETKGETKTNWGIVITSFTGIVITSITGIVITSSADTTVNCGIVITS